MRLIKGSLFLALATYMSAGVAGAQAPPAAPMAPLAHERPVTVDLSRVRGRVASEINADPAQVPDSLPLPASEAAHVCGTSEEALRAPGGPNHCVAQTTSTILDMEVRREGQTANQAPSLPPSSAAPAPSR